MRPFFQAPPKRRLYLCLHSQVPAWGRRSQCRGLHQNPPLKYPPAFPAPHPLPGWLAKDIVSRHLTCPSMLCVISIQDWMSINERLRLADENAERINIPADPHHYWRYRMHVNIEDLTKDEEFSHTISELILEADRK